MDAHGSHLKEFYGCLVLLRLLTPNRTENGLGSSMNHAAPKPNEWHKFLDSLAWLADHKCGGRTVTAIAVECTNNRSTYWIASNSVVSPDVVQHIKGILSDLDREASSDMSSSMDLIRRIAAKSIKFSWTRVQDYSRRLKGTIAAIDSNGSLVALEESHQQHLNSFLELSRDSNQLIDLSFDLKRSSFLNQLNALTRWSEHHSLWKQVRHLLGRLCSWVRAAQNLVLTCKQFHNRIKNVRVEPVEMSLARPISFRLPWREPSDILREILPEFHESRLQNALLARQNDKLVDPIIQCLSRMTEGKFDPNLHAEIILLLHFHVHRLKFIADERYIACSKPSCYCCDLYLRCHPAGVVPRRSHGNIWVKWAAPELHPGMVTGEADVLPNILRYVKSDLSHQIMAGPTLARRPPDSTTGICSTEPRYDLG